MVPAVTELCYPHPAHSWTRRLAIYPRLRPPQRGQTKPFGQRCAVRCSPHRTSSPKRERNSLTVMMDFRFNGLDFFISDILSPFVRLFKLDIHLFFFMFRADFSPRGTCPSDFFSNLFSRAAPVAVNIGL